MRYLLLGNPNVGKSSIFNLLTNVYAHVGNYGGITVESKVGKFGNGEIIDLPGTYSVSPNSEDEGVVTYSLINDHYNGIIDVVDSTHLKRNLHLTIQLLELGAPTYLVTNMIDELKQSGMKIDINKLSSLLKCPVIPVSARTKKGIEELRLRIKDIEVHDRLYLDYGTLIENAIEEIKYYLRADTLHVDPRWLAIQILEGNDGILEYIELNKQNNIKKIVKETEDTVINTKIALSLKGAIFNKRREFIEDVLNQSLIVISTKNHAKYFNHKIDKYVTHPIFGLFIFVFVMFSIYFLTFDLFGTMLSDLIDGFITNTFTPFVVHSLKIVGVNQDSILMSLLVDGVIAGVGGVIIFVPQIAILFFILAIIEGTGYMARVAIMLDTLLSKFGLNGKSIVPLVTGIGCNVPAIMATRTISDKKERLLTILIIPFMSCSARIPVYALLASLFFDKYKAMAIISMYIIGTCVALISAKILSLSIFKNKTNNFVLEIPPYRIPSGRNVIRHTRLMIKDFIGKAGKFILLGTIILWFLQYVGPNGIAVTQDSSFLAYLGNFISPIFTPLGFGTWQSSSSLLVGFLAKELILSSMIVIYGGEPLVHLAFTGLSAYSFMVFSLLYLPCLATVGTIYQETKSIKFTLYSLLFTFLVAYVVTFIIYQVGLIIF